MGVLKLNNADQPTLGEVSIGNAKNNTCLVGILGTVNNRYVKVKAQNPSYILSKQQLKCWPGIIYHANST